MEQTNKTYYEFPLLKQTYKCYYAGQLPFFLTANEILDLFNELEEFPKNRLELKFGITLKNGLTVKEN